MEVKISIGQFTCGLNANEIIAKFASALIVYDKNGPFCCLQHFYILNKSGTLRIVKLHSDNEAGFCILNVEGLEEPQEDFLQKINDKLQNILKIHSTQCEISIEGAQEPIGFF
ncbi:MAG: hypothetical protein KBD14_02240 [Candidatus Pacebacteria bacterium]|nr:hypothetical protein [Candidatus Paceibacterota bacterium]